jgi:peptide/nickel transport system permease protein
MGDGSETSYGQGGSGMNVIFRVVKHKRFIIGFLIFFGLLILSLTFNHLVRPIYPKTFDSLIYDKAGYLIAKAPSPPSKIHPLGTDGNGIPYELILLPGLKQYVGIAVAVTVLRMGLSFLMALVISSLKKKTYYMLEHIFHVFQFIPGTLLAFIVLAPIRVPDMKEQTILWIVVLSLIALPNLSIVLASEMRKVKSREFIEATKILGGGAWHIFRVHVIKFLKSKLLILLNQQLVQVLVMMIALSLLYVPLSYTTMAFHLDTQSGDGLNVSWASLIADGKKWIWVMRWLLIDPALAIFIIIISIQMMTSAVRRVAEGEDIKMKRKKPEEVTPPRDVPYNFDFVERKEF